MYPIFRRMIIALCSGWLLGPWACTSAAPLTIAVAANVKYPFDNIAARFRDETGIEVRGVFGSTGKIAAQVRSGAPFDVFISADTETTDALYKDGLAVTQPKTYAYGVLVLWASTNLDLGKGLPLLADASVRKIAIANPAVAPYGRAAMQALRSAKLDATVAPKLVYGESIGQTAQFVESGAADIGFVAKSIVVAPEMTGRGRYMEVPVNSYAPIAQSVVVLKHGTEIHSEAARRFTDFLLAPEARSIFRRYGYVLP